jgi:phage-related protein
MPGGEDIYQTIGFILEVKDLASGIATRAQKILDAAASGVQNTLLDMTTAIDTAKAAAEAATTDITKGVETVAYSLSDMTTDARREISRSLAAAAAQIDENMTEVVERVEELPKKFRPLRDTLGFIGKSFRSVFGEMAIGPLRLFRDRALLPTMKVVTDFGSKVKTTFLAIPKAIKGIATKDIKFEHIFDAGVKGAKGLGTVLTKGLGTALGGVKTAGGLIGTVFGKGFGLMKTGAVAAGSAVNRVFQTTLGLTKIAGSLGKGGLMGALLGPIGPLLTLLSPLINALTRAFAPALETLEALIDAAFAPFAGLLDTIMQSMMPLINKALGPLVSLLELGAAQLGVMLQGFVDSEDAASGFSAVLKALLPVGMKVFNALVGLGKTIIPVIIKLVQTLAPIAGKVIGMVGDAFAKLMPIIGNVIETALPGLIEGVGKLLEAVLPLLPPLLKLGTVLAEHVFAPLLIATIELITEAVTELATYLSEDVIPVVVPFIEDISEQVVDFFTHLGKYTSDFYILFIKPIVDAVGDLVKFLGLDKAAAAVGSAFDAILKAAMSPIETMKGLINTAIIGPLNSILGWKIPVVGDPLGKVLGIGEIAKLASGGIATGPTTAMIGEGGVPEAVVPLKPQTIREFVAPVLGDLQLPGLDKAAATLERIEALLRGTLSVSVKGGEGGEESRSSAVGPRGGSSSDERDLAAASGIDGLAWAAGG